MESIRTKVGGIVNTFSKTYVNLKITSKMTVSRTLSDSVTFITIRIFITKRVVTVNPKCNKASQPTLQYIIAFMILLWSLQERRSEEMSIPNQNCI